MQFLALQKIYRKKYYINYYKTYYMIPRPFSLKFNDASLLTWKLIKLESKLFGLIRL